MSIIPAPYKLRPAHEADTAAVKELIYSILHDYGLKPDPQGTDYGLDHIEDYYAFFDIIEDGEGRMVGTVGLHKINDQRCELVKMFLLKEHRGKGLGAGLLAHVTTAAKDLGFEWMELETATSLKEARALYTKAGFTLKPSQPESSRCDIVMEKAL